MTPASVVQTAFVNTRSAFAGSGFRQYLAQVRQRTLNEGVSAATLDPVLPSPAYNEKVVCLDRAQPEGAADALMVQIAINANFVTSHAYTSYSSPFRWGRA